MALTRPPKRPRPLWTGIAIRDAKLARALRVEAAGQGLKLYELVEPKLAELIPGYQQEGAK